MDDQWRQDLIRQQIIENQRRASEEAAVHNMCVWFEWNDPNYGFWAQIAKQDEYNQWLSEQSARRTDEAFSRQLDFAMELGRRKPSDVGPHDPLVSRPEPRLATEHVPSDPLINAHTAATPPQDQTESLRLAYYGKFSEDDALKDLW